MEAIINGEFKFSEIIIQRIQSFLNPKQAAQTTVLSKSWYKAWLTRPNLDFNQRDFRKNDNDTTVDEFYEFAKTTIQRYEESNLKIESFRLSMEDAVCNRLVNESIVKALKLGATRLSFKLEARFLQFVLPDEVFEAENLVEISVEGCKIKLATDRTVRCSRLESLSLSRVEIKCETLHNILSSCPLIEKLSLSYVNKLGYLDDCDPINFCKLRCLVLVSVNIDTLFFGDFSSTLPSLRELTLKYCSVHEVMVISSHSLERLDIADTSFRFTFDVPSIRKFTFVGSFIPSVTFESTSHEWESHVTVSDHRLNSLWFCKLSKFLTELRPSKIYLAIRVHLTKSFDYDVGDVQCLRRPEVENLTVGVNYLPSLSCYALFDGLFRLCRPKFVTQYLVPGKTNCGFLCNQLVLEMNDKCSSSSHIMYGLHDLNEVNVEIYEESVAEWRSLPLKLLLDASTSPQYKQKVRFQLKWSP